MVVKKALVPYFGIRNIIADNLIIESVRLKISREHCLPSPLRIAQDIVSVSIKGNKNASFLSISPAS